MTECRMGRGRKRTRDVRVDDVLAAKVRRGELVDIGTVDSAAGSSECYAESA